MESIRSSGRHTRRYTWLTLVIALNVVTAFANSRDDYAATAAGMVRHVFVIVLENKDFGQTFYGSTQDPYLQKTLVPMGGLLAQYYGTGHLSLDNYLSMISGQAATPDTADDCLPGLKGSKGNYNNVVQTGTARNGQVIASGGCIYGARVRTLVDQLSAAGLTWKGYMEDMGNDPVRERRSCGHPRFGIGTDDTNTAEAPSAAVPDGDAYATRHNPFMYFHSIIDSPRCRQRVVNLRQLSIDLASSSSTPNFAFISPNVCHDGHDGAGTGAPGTTCANGEPGGLTSVDAFLELWVPRIFRSPAYKENGLLIITFDEGNYTEYESRDQSSGRTMVTITFPGQTCCNEQPGPNLNGIRPGTMTVVDTSARVEQFVVNGYGGDRIGALLLSPFVKPGSASEMPYNHYSLLRSLENIFRLREYLGYAADDPFIGYHLDTIENDHSIFQERRHPSIAFGNSKARGSAVDKEVDAGNERRRVTGQE